MTEPWVHEYVSTACLHAINDGEVPGELRELYDETVKRSIVIGVPIGDIDNVALAAVIAEVRADERAKVAEEQAEWLPRLINIVFTFATRSTYTPADAEEALRHVPGRVMDAARIARGAQ